jgi:hypothetical protein
MIFSISIADIASSVFYRDPEVRVRYTVPYSYFRIKILLSNLADQAGILYLLLVERQSVVIIQLDHMHVYEYTYTYMYRYV